MATEDSGSMKGVSEGQTDICEVLSMCSCFVMAKAGVFPSINSS